MGFPRMFFKVEWAPNPPPPPPGQLQVRSVLKNITEPQREYLDNMRSGRVLESSLDGRQMCREHVTWAA